MSMQRLACVLASSAFLAACVAVPPSDAPAKRVSPDYMATGQFEGVRAYVYGQRTVLEFTSMPAYLSIVDGHGVSVPFQREGRFARLARKLDDFTVRANLQTMAFRLVKPAQPAAMPVADADTDADTDADADTAAPHTVASVPVMVHAAPASSTQPSDADVATLVKTASRQMNEVRMVIKRGVREATQRQALDARLDGIEARASSAAVLQVQFARYKTEFQPSPELARVLLAAARSAEQVNLRGFTDSVVAGPMDASIAKARALSARRYLMSHGVAPSKIKFSSLAAGDAIAPCSSAECKAMNRRVEIEIVSSRIAALAQQNLELAQEDSYFGTN